MFENLKISLKFGNKGVIYTKNPFDGVLAYLYVQQLKRKGEYLGENQELELPFLKKTNGVYHTSYPIFSTSQDVVLESMSMIKAFDQKLNQKIGNKPNSNIDIQRAWAKSFILQYESLLIDSLSFYVCGDIALIKELLKDLTHYGKKSALGYGEVKEIVIKKIDKDFSLLSENGEPNRILPVRYFSNIQSDRIAMKRPIFPYFERQGLEPCYM